MNPRDTALNVLYEIDKNSAYMNLQINKAFKSRDLKPLDKKFISEIVNGVIKNKIRLDYIISSYSSIKINKITHYVLNILRIGVYQILFMDKVPDSAAVNESVKLARKYSHNRTSGYVNGVLRSISRDFMNIKYPSDKREYLSVYYSYPKWIIDDWSDEFGEKFTQSLLESNNEKSKLYLRCNTLKTDVFALKEMLLEEGIESTLYNNSAIPNLDYVLELNSISSIESLKTYKNGLFYIQDVGSMIISEVLSPKENDIIIDMCAAPGGKTTHMAQIMKNKGKIYAFDIYDHKVGLINENASRLGIDIIDAEIRDASEPASDFMLSADKVLLDAPCSGFGIIRRKPDIKYLRTKKDITILANQSLKLLDTASKYVKNSGVLVFSTCSIQKEENQDVINEFLKNHGNFRLEKITEYDKINDGYITLYPNIDGTDGFFICKLRKQEN